MSLLNRSGQRGRADVDGLVALDPDPDTNPRQVRHDDIGRVRAAGVLLATTGIEAESAQERGGLAFDHFALHVGVDAAHRSPPIQR